MSAIRTAATTTTKHTRTLSQPLRRTFYSPFAALQRSPLTKSPSSSAPSNNNATTTTSGDAAVHEHEREHAARTLHVVSEPNTTDFKYGVPAGAYPVAAPYHPMVAANATTAYSALENVSPSSTSSTPAHPVLTRAALHDTAATTTSVGGMGAPGRPSGPRFARGEKGAPGGEGGVGRRGW